MSLYKKPNITINTGDWPANNGCSNEEKDKLLYKGQHIDRFGSNNGFFFGLPGQPYVNRSLPWFGNYSSTDKAENDKIRERFYKFYSEADKDKNPEHDYHLYKVTKPFSVKSCTIAPAFGFPGGGKQYRSDINVETLKKTGFIKEVPWIHSPFFDDSDIFTAGSKKTLKQRKRKTKTKHRRYRKRYTVRKKIKIS